MTRTVAPFDAAAIGRSGEPVSYRVTREAIRAYADAVDELRHDVAPPVFAVVPAWGTIAPASRSVASDAARARVVHYEHDMLLHRPIEAGMALVSQAAPVALLPRPNGTSLVIRAETRDEDGGLVAEQYATEFFRGVEAPAARGERAPAHRLEVDREPDASVTYTVANDQPERYAAASGDDFAIHLDDGFARSVGLPGRIVHGLCTLAFAGRAVLEAAGGGDLRRLAVRFSAPLFPGERLTTRIWELEPGVHGFDAVAGDRVVLKDGRAELR